MIVPSFFQRFYLSPILFFLSHLTYYGLILIFIGLFLFMIKLPKWQAQVDQIFWQKFEFVKRNQNFTKCIKSKAYSLLLFEH